MFTKTLPDHAKRALALLGKSGLLSNAYLAGGSALALHFGHRYSIDLDFFSKELFDPKKLSVSLGEIGTFKESVVKGVSLIGTFDGVKISYFQYDYPLIASLSKIFDVNVAHPCDIAAMKIVAIMDRGTKRDFVDLFELVNQGFTLEKIFSFYDKKYGTFESNCFSIIKSLQYFDEAEQTDMPQMIKKASWEKVKDFFAKESLRLAHRYL